MGSSTNDNRIDRAFEGRAPGLWPFLPAGYPDLETTVELIRRCGSLPVRGFEIGFPFSDPIADGPVIQAAFAHALDAGVTAGGVFDAVASAREACDLPMLAMVSASIVHRIGVEAFVDRARRAGFDGLIVPDTSLEEAPVLAEAARAADLRLAMLVAPTSSPERQRRIASIASGFLYYVSVQGTTGERDALAADLAEHVESLRRASGLPVLVGFGISRREHVEAVCRLADGAIVGSAIVRRIGAAMAEAPGRGRVVESVVEFVAGLTGGTP